MRKEMKLRSRKYQQILNRLKDAALQRLNKLPLEDVTNESEEFNENAMEIFFNSILKEIDRQKTTLSRVVEEKECTLNEMSDQKERLLTEKNELNKKLEDLQLENCNLKIEIASAGKAAREENEEILKRLEQVKEERDHLLGKVNVLHQNIQELDGSFKETRWALTAEVAVKHDQIQELKKCVAALEEQIRQANMKTLFQDDIIKEMRKELKRKSVRPGVCDVTTKLTPTSSGTRENMEERSVSFKERDDSRGSRSCTKVSIAENISGSSGEFDEIFDNFDEMSVQAKLECLKQTLKLKIQQMQAQDECIQELECLLKKAKKDITCLQEKCEGKDQSRNLIELSKYETKIKKAREILLCAICRVEHSLQNLSTCHCCDECNSVIEVAKKEAATVRGIKRDVEALQFKKASRELESVSPRKTSEKSTSRHSSVDRSQDGSKVSCLNPKDINSFRMDAITGVTVLEGMKEQIDLLHELMKKYYQELPQDYEKCQIEECENKIEKLHTEFDVITDKLCAMIDRTNKELKNITREGSSKNAIEPTCDCKTRINLEAEKQKVCALKEEQKRLQEDICERERYLNDVTMELGKIEAQIKEKQCKSAETEKELRATQQEISRLRGSLKEFKDCLQIEASENVNDKPKLGMIAESCSDLSILSIELQELCEILVTSQTSLPGIIEKYKEENQQMKDKLNCWEKCLRNKEETVQVLQESLKLKEKQIEDLQCKISHLDSEVANLQREVEEKIRLICNLQDSMRKAKEFEIKVKDESIDALQFEVCELDHRLKTMVKEVIKKGREIDVLQDEILYVSSKNFFLNREIDLLEPKLSKMQKNLILYESMVSRLQNELDNREEEAQTLYREVKKLEEDMSCELQICEKRAQEDSECINELNETVRCLQAELQSLRGSGKKPDYMNTICHLRDEIKSLRKQLKETKQDETNARIADLENILRQEQCRQQAYNDKINKLQKTLEETIASHDCETNNLMQRLSKEENENMKNKSTISKLKDEIKCKTKNEASLQKSLKQLKCDLNAAKSENETLRELLKYQNFDEQSVERRCAREAETDSLITNLKARCCSFKRELEKEEETKKSLECRIQELNEMLVEKTQQFNQLSQNYQCTSAKAEEALVKLKDAEYRLKCMKMERNSGVMDEDEECDSEDDEDLTNTKCLQESLQAKTAECSDLMSEVQCLQVKIKTMQGEFISSQANKDCELSRLNREIDRLESELDFLEKENGNLKHDLRKIQDELENRSRLEECYKQEIESKEKELQDAMAKKSELLCSIEDLQKQLEEMCMDNSQKEKENRDLREESALVKNELKELQCDHTDLQCAFQSINSHYNDALEKLKCSEKKRANLEKLFNDMNEKNCELEDMKSQLEKEICEIETENVMLKEKLICATKQKEQQAKKFMAENSNSSEEKMKYCSKIKDLNNKLKNLEENVIPDLENEILTKNRCIMSFKIELEDANLNNKRLRDESLRVIQHTKKYLTAQRCANDHIRRRSECSNDNRHYLNTDDIRELDEQLKTVTRMNESLYFELQNEKNDYQDTEPRTYSPLPWGCTNMKRDDNSNECLAESGFQSMQPSPTNMNEYAADMKRTSSDWSNNVGRYG